MGWWCICGSGVGRSGGRDGDDGWACVACAVVSFALRMVTVIAFLSPTRVVRFLQSLRLCAMSVMSSKVRWCGRSVYMSPSKPKPCPNYTYISFFGNYEVGKIFFGVLRDIFFLLERKVGNSNYDNFFC